MKNDSMSRKYPMVAIMMINMQKQTVGLPSAVA